MRVEKALAFSFLLSSVLVLGCGGAEVSSADASAAEAQALEAQGYLQTPVGMVHRSCVHALEEGASVEEGGNIQHAGGRLEEVAPCQSPLVTLGGNQPQTAAASVGKGWIEFGYWESLHKIGRFDASFIVPAAPRTAAGVVFLFPSLQTRPVAGAQQTILQSVIQYGVSAAGGGKYWAMASWVGGPKYGGRYYHGALRTVKTGDTIDGSMFVDHGDCPNGKCRWQAFSQVRGTSIVSSLWTHTDIAWTEVDGGVLEGYGLSSCANYPASHASFWGHKIWYWDGSLVPAPTYYPQRNILNCGESVVTAPGYVTLGYD